MISAVNSHDEFESIAALDAIGAATANESNALRAHLTSCPDCSRARDEYAEAASLFARELDPVTPPPRLRDRIVAVADAGEPANVIDARDRFNSSRWWMAAAVVFLALWGWRELSVRVTREKINSSEAEVRRLAGQNQLLAARNEKLSAEMASLASRDTRTIALTGQQVSPSASAKVFLEPQQRRAVVFFYNLPANAADKSYQLWILRADQPKPQSAGVFDVTKSGAASILIENLPLATEIKGLAVTLEPKGGVAQPTNTNFFVAGST
ncbi:MAG TPA: anti-sigma factor [Thermoanaerobaculia bacterium]|jgi:anti-sigma-K factor RskA|nr:anti-sigma factor [Thermoanaerobaculia bacterium]